MKKINTKPYIDVISNVFIDDREVDRKDYAMKQYASFNPKIVHLTEGDYLFKGYNGVYVCIEYKTGDDFLSSIGQGETHLHNQVYSMIHKNDYNFIMIECKNMKSLLGKRYYQTGMEMSIPEVNGAIAEFNTVCTVLQGQTKYACFDLMMRVAAKIIMEKPFLYKFRKKSKNTALNYLSSIHGLDKKSYAICKELDLHTVQDLFELSVEDLIRIDGIGKVTAEKIIGEIKS